jgi:hypothetical protein
VALLFAVAPPAAGQGREVGWAVRVEREVYREEAGALVPLLEKHSVRAGWHLTSGPRSFALLNLVPRTVLGLGENSDLRLSDSAPSGVRACPKFEVRSRARLRFSGVLAYADCQLTLTTRDTLLFAQGTDFAVAVDPVFGTLVTVFEGSVRMEGTKGGFLGTVEAGETVVVVDGAPSRLPPEPPGEDGGPAGPPITPDPPILPPRGQLPLPVPLPPPGQSGGLP